MKTISASVIAKELGTSRMKIKSGILNGTLPIGTVLTEGKHDRVIIIEDRWEAWKTGKDLRRKGL